MGRGAAYEADRPVCHQPTSASGRLSSDLASGEWDQRYGELRQRPALDVGLRLICAELRDR